MTTSLVQNWKSQGVLTQKALNSKRILRKYGKKGFQIKYEMIGFGFSAIERYECTQEACYNIPPKNYGTHLVWLRWMLIKDPFDSHGITALIQDAHEHNDCFFPPHLCFWCSACKEFM